MDEMTSMGKRFGCIETWWFLGLLGAVLLLAYHEIWDRDIFFHLANGRALLEHGVPLKENLFTWTTSRLPFYQNPAWLFGILVANVYAMAGMAGVVVFKSLILVAVFFILYDYLRKENAPAWAAAILLFLVAMASALRFNERPDLFSILFFGMFIWTTQKIRKGNARFIWFFPGSMLLWANLHSGCVFGLIYLILYWGGDLMERSLRVAPSWFGGKPAEGTSLRSWPFVIAATVAAIFLTPTPFGNLRFLWQHLHVTDVVPVAEYGFPSPALVPWYWVLLLTILFLLLKRPILQLSVVLPAGFFTALSLSGVRFIPFFAMAILPVVAPALASLHQDRSALGTGWQKIRHGLTVLGPVLMIGLVLVSPPVPGAHSASINRTMVPLDAFRFLNSVELRGNLYNSMSFGGAGMFYLFPRYRLYQTSYIQVEEDRQAEAYQASKNPIAWRGFLDRYGIDIVLLDINHEEPTPVYFPPETWSLVFFDDVAAIFVRRKAENNEIIARNEYRVVHPSLFFATDGLARVNPDQLSQGLEELQRAVQWSPDSYLLHMMTGYYLNAAPGRREDALSAFEQALQIRPDGVEALFQFGILLIERHEYRRAAKFLEKYAKHMPDDSLGFLFLAQAQEQAGEYKAAVRSLRRGLKADPGEGQLYWRLGVLMRERQEFAEALENMQRATELLTDNPDVLVDMGVTVGMAGDHKQAIAWFDRALFLRPDYPAALHNRDYAQKLLQERYGQ